MSKTRLTGIHPFQVLDHFGVDAYRYHFLREVSFGKDGSFSWESMEARYTADLANGLGNLASRVLAMVDSYFGGAVPARPEGIAPSRLVEAGRDLAARFDAHILAVELTEAVAALDGFVREANKYLVEAAPWALAKDPARREELAAILYDSTEALRLIALYASPVMPGAARRLWEQLGMTGSVTDQRVPEAAAWGGTPAGARVRRGDALFPRLEE
jgi:methionyl-tRNA synthetase